MLHFRNMLYVINTVATKGTTIEKSFDLFLHIYVLYNFTDHLSIFFFFVKLMHLYFYEFVLDLDDLLDLFGALNKNLFLFVLNNQY